MEHRIRLAEVNTWYAEHGVGDPLVLLHPGGADARAWAPNLDALGARFRVLTPERRGHGRIADVDGPITYELMVRDTIAFTETVAGTPVHLVGCSVGAVVALMVALARPDLVDRLVLVSGVYHRDGWYPEAIDPHAEPHPALRRGYEQLSPDGGEHYPIVQKKLARMNYGEPTLTEQELAGVTSRTLVMVADDDEVTLEHAVATYRAIPDAELAVVPGASHGLLHEKPLLCNTILTDFLAADSVPTIAPVRRRNASGG